LPDVLVTGHAELAVFRPHLLGEVRTMRIVAFLAFRGYRRVNVTRLLVPAHPVLVAGGTELIALGHEQFRLPGRVRLVTEDARPHRRRSMQMLLFHERVAGMTGQAKVLGRIGPQQLKELTLVGIVAVGAATLSEGLVDIVPDRHDMTRLTQRVLGVAQAELVGIWPRRRMTSGAHALGHRVMDDRLLLQTRVTAEVSARLARHVGRRGYGGTEHR